MNTLTSLTVNFACIFAHKRYKYAEKSVGLLVRHLQTPVDVYQCFTLILSPIVSAPELDLLRTARFVFSLLQFSVGWQLAKRCLQLPSTGYYTKNVTVFFSFLVSSFSSVQIW